MLACFVQTTGWYFFLKQKNSYHCKHVTDHTFMTLKKSLLFSFADGGVGGHTISYIIGLNILKLQPIQFLEAVVSP